MGDDKPVRCEFSELYEDQCAHCLGHHADWETGKHRQEDQPV